MEQKHDRLVQPILYQCAQLDHYGVVNNFTTGFMCVRQTPHTFGNESHKIYCGITSILWRANHSKGKDIPEQLIPKLHLELRRTVGIMFRMCKPLFSAAKYIVMDSGFLFQMGLLYLRKREYIP